MTPQQITAPEGPIHIALTFDANFWAPAYATMRSVCLYSRRRDAITFHLLHRTLDARKKADLGRIETEFGARLEWYDLDQSTLFDTLAKTLPENKRLSNIVYARLMIDRLVDPAIRRVLYIDCDVLVRASIEQLYDIDLAGNAIAAVRDPAGPIIFAGRDFAGNRDLFDIADSYFNAGVILIDLERWKARDLLGLIERFMADGTMARLYYDQDFLNIAFARDWLALPPVWNLMDPHRTHEPLDPRIVHYTGESKPWNLVSSVAFHRTYRHVMTNDLFYRYMRHRWKMAWVKRWRKLTGR